MEKAEKKASVWRLFKSYVGSKASYVNKLREYSNRPFVELFAGSGVLSLNLAKSAVLCDSDPVIFNVLSRFDELVVPEVFTADDYARVRKLPDFWRHSYCLSAMAFSGVFRHNKNGFSVPMKKTLKEVRVRDCYLAALARWKELKPKVLNCDYKDVSLEDIRGVVCIADPPFEQATPTYSSANPNFNYNIYWQYLRECVMPIAKALIVFDFVSNLEKQGIPVCDTRKLRVNGARAGNVEGMAIFDGGWKVKGIEI